MEINTTILCIPIYCVDMNKSANKLQNTILRCTNMKN